MASTPATTARTTPLNAVHIAMQARMVDFSGWQMPLQYGKVMEEHHAVRAAAGLFDISHMGLVVVKSATPEHARAFLDSLVPRSLAKLHPGKAVYTQFLNPQGGIIDDIIVYCMPEADKLTGFDDFLVICNAGNTPKDVEWMQSHATTFKDANSQPISVDITLVSTDYSLLALQGPAFADVLARTGFDSDFLPGRFQITEALIQDMPVWLSRTGYTGEDGVEIIVANHRVEALWNLLLDLGKPNGVKPIGLAARDTLRLEAAYPLHGHDITEKESPLEAGLGWSVKLDKSADFIGKQALQQQLRDGLPQEFYCFTLNKRTIAREHDEIVKDGVVIGRVTSGSISPLYNVPIGMGYIQTGAVNGPGELIQIRIRGTEVDAEIVERPFYLRTNNKET